jgi:hypothetical protein
MKLATALVTATALIAAPAFANEQRGASDKAPGQQMKDQGSKPGTTGASGYAPGQQMQDQGSKPGTTGASGYAPGQSTTGQGDSKPSQKSDDSKQ